MFAGDKGIDWKIMDCLMSVRIFDKSQMRKSLKLIWKILCVVPDVGCIMILMCAKAITEHRKRISTAGAMLLGNISLKSIQKQ